VNVLGIVKSVVWGVGGLLLRTGKAEIVERLASAEFAETVARRVNENVDLPWLTEEQEQIAIERVVRAAFAEASALLSKKG